MSFVDLLYAPEMSSQSPNKRPIKAVISSSPPLTNPLTMSSAPTAPLGSPTAPPQPQMAPSSTPLTAVSAPMQPALGVLASPARSAESQPASGLALAPPIAAVAGDPSSSGKKRKPADFAVPPSAETVGAAVPPPAKKPRTNTPWTPEEEQRLKAMRDAGNSWSEIAKTFPTRTEGSVKKHWYKDMHYAEFAEDESAALLAAIKEYDANKWKVVGQKVGKPAKACEQYAKEHFKL